MTTKNFHHLKDGKDKLQRHVLGIPLQGKYTYAFQIRDVEHPLLVANRVDFYFLIYMLCPLSIFLLRVFRSSKLKQYVHYRCCTELSKFNEYLLKIM